MFLNYEMEQLNKKVDKLSSKLGEMNPKKQNKNEKGKGKKKGKTKKKNNSGANSSGSNVFNFNKREILTAVKGEGKETILLKPSATVMPFLGNLMSAFTEYKIHRMTFYWVSAVGTTKDGLMTMGFKAGAKGEATDSLSKIVALSPSLSTPVWEKATMAVPNDRLMSRKIYLFTSPDDLDAAPGSLMYYNSGEKDKIMGAIWVHYHVSLSGPRS